MEDKKLPLVKSVQPDGASDSLEYTDADMPVSEYSAAPKEYPVDETLEVHAQGSPVARATVYAPGLQSVPFSRRKATAVSLAITVIVVLLTGLVSALFIKKDDNRTSQLNIPTQDVTLESEATSTLPELQGAEGALLVNGDIISRGTIKVTSGEFVSVIRAESLTSNQEFVLPNSSGTLCVDANNCNYTPLTQFNQQAAQVAAQAVTLAEVQAQLGQIVVPPAGVTSLNNQAGAVSIQGALNRITVSTSGGTITLSTPQDLATISSPTFAGLLLNGGLTVSGNIITPLDCTGNLNGGALTANGAGQIVCSNDDGGGGGGAPTDATYLVAALNAALTDERALTAGSNIQFTDGGANGNFTIATVQNPTFTTSVTTPLLTSAGAMNITPGGALTVGAVGQSVLLQGSTATITSSAGNDIILNSGDTINLQDSTNITGTLAVTGNVTGGTYNGQTISAAANFTGTVSVATSITTPSLVFTGAGSNGGLQVANLGQTTTYTLPDPGQATADICLSTGNCVGGAGGAPNNAAYLTVGNNATLTGERAIAVNATNLTFTDGGANGSYTINTIQNIATTSTPTFAGLTLNGNLNVGANTIQGTTAVINFNNFDVSSTGAVTAVGVSAGTGLLQGTGGLTVGGTITLSNLTNGFLEVDGSGVVSVGTINLGADTAGDYVANLGALTGLSTTGNSGEGSTPTLSVLYGSTANTAVQGNTGITVTAGTNLTGGGSITLGAGGSVTVNVADSPTFAGDVVIQGGDLTLGTAANPAVFTLHDGDGETIAFDLPDVSASYVLTLPSAVGSANQCLKAQDGTGTLFWDDCTGGAGGGLAGSGTLNRLAKFTPDGSTIGNSSLSDDGTTVTVNGNVNLDVQGTTVTVGVGSTRTGSIALHNSTNNNTVTIQSGTTGTSYTLTLPTGVGSTNQCLKAQNGTGTLFWDDCEGGAGGTSGVTSLNSLTSDLTLQGTANQITVNDNGTDTITLSTPQDIHTGATPTFAGLNTTGDVTSNTQLRVLESLGATFYGIFDVGDLSADQTFTFLNGGTVVTSGNVGTYATTGVTAGSGLTGGGTTGALTVDIASANGGIVVNANDIALTLQANKGLEVDVNGLSLIDCSTDQILKYNGSNQWACAADAGGSGVGDDISVNGVAATNANFLDTAATGTSAATTWSLNTGSTPDDITLTIGNASATEAGAVTTGTQTFAGAKTFSTSVTTPTLQNAGAITLGTTATAGADDIIFQTAGTEKLRILENGDLFFEKGANDVTFAVSTPGAGATYTFSGATGTVYTSANDPLDTIAEWQTLCTDCVSLGGDTIGNYVATITAGNGISGGSATEGGTPTIDLGNLTANWTQGGAFDIVLNNSASELVVLDSDGTHSVTLDVGNLTADVTYQFANPAGGAGTYDICTTDGNCIGAGGGGAPNNAEYLVVSLNGTLSSERALAAGSNIQFTDAGANNNFTVATTQNPTFTTSVTTPLLTSTGALAITPGGALTVGATGQTALLQGSTTNITSTGATNDITLTSADQIILNSTGTIELQDNTNVTGTLGVTGAVTAGTYNGQTISSAASLTGTLSVATSVTTPLLTSTGTLTLTPGGAMTLGATGQTALLQGSTTNITSTGATNDITLTSADQIVLNSTSTIELQDDTNITGNTQITGTLDVGSTIQAGSSNVNLTLATGFIDGDALTLIAAADGGTGTFSGSGLEIRNDGIGLLQGCADLEVLKWDEANDWWECAVDNGGTNPWSTDTGVVNLVTDSDTVTIGSATAGGKLFVDGDADEVQLQIQGHSTQTSNLLLLEQSGGTDVFTVTNAGNTAMLGDLTVTGGNIGLGTAPTSSLLTILGSAGEYEIYSSGDAETNFITDGSLYLGFDANNNSGVAEFAIYNDGSTEVFGITGSNGRIAGDFAVNGGDITSSAATLNINASGSGTIGLQDNTSVTGTLDVSSTIQAGSSNVNLTLATGFIDADALTLIAAADGGTGTFSGSGLEIRSDGIGLLQGCADLEVLKWDETNDWWECAVDNGGTNPWSTDAGVVNLVTDGDTVTIGSATAGGKLFVDGDANEIQLQVQANGTQTADLFVIESSAGADYFTVEGDGDVVLAANKSLRLTGGATGSRPGSPAEGMLFYDTTTDRLLTYANGKWQGDRTSSTKIVAASNSSQADKDAADYIADGTGDQVEINAALTAGAGGQVHLMPGTYTISASVSVPNNTILTGAGRGTLLQLADLDVDVQMITNASQSPGTGVVVKDMRLDGRKSLNTAGEQIAVYFINLGDESDSTAIPGGKATGLWIENFRNEGVYLWQTDNVIVSDNVIQNGTNNGIKLYRTSSNNTVTGNRLQANGGHGIYLEWSASYNTVSNNISQNNGGDGIRIFDKSNNNSISGNVTQENGVAGIVLADYIEGGTVSGNTSVENTEYGIFLSRLGDEGLNDYENASITVTGNTVQDNAVSGIEIFRASDNTISGNKIHNNGGATTNRGIAFDESDDNNVSGNSITDTSCTTTCYAINVTNSSSADNFLSNNTIETGTINDSGTNTIFAGQVDNNGEYRVGIDLFVEDKLGFGVQTITLTDDGTANDTLTATATYVRVNQDETNNVGVPNLAFSETGAKDGDLLIVVNGETDGTNGQTFTITDSAGVVNVNASPKTINVESAIMFIYMGDRWVSIGFSDN